MGGPAHGPPTGDPCWCTILQRALKLVTAHASGNLACRTSALFGESDVSHTFGNAGYELARPQMCGALIMHSAACIPHDWSVGGIPPRANERLLVLMQTVCKIFQSQVRLSRKRKNTLARLLQAIPPNQAGKPALQTGDCGADDARQLLCHGGRPRGATAGAGALEQYLLYNRWSAYAAESSIQL